MAFRQRSKFHNVNSVTHHATCYPEARPSTAENSQLIAASGTHIIVGWATRGGASVGIRKLSDTGKEGAGWAIAHPNSQTITDIRFHPYRDDVLATAGEDGKVVLSRLPADFNEENPLEKLAQLEHGNIVSVVRFHPSADNVIGTAGTDNAVKIWDVNGPKEAASISLPGAVDDLSWNWNGTQAIAVDRAKNLHVLDPRAGSSVNKIEAHQGNRPMKCFWVGNTPRVATIGFTKMRERELRVWDSRTLAKSLGSTSFGSAHGVLVPHFDPDSKLAYLAGRGEGCVYTIDMSSEKAPHHQALMTGKIMDKESQLSICMLPKRGLNVMECEVGRIFRIIKDRVQIFNMQVSRPNKDIFYPELFPESPSGFSQTAEEYFSGGAKDPIMTSLEPK